MLRDAADKKIVIIYAIKEKNVLYKLKRDKEEAKTVNDLLKKLNDEDETKSRKKWKKLLNWDLIWKAKQDL